MRKTASELAFLQLVISLASPSYTVHVGQALKNLDERHQIVIFKAMRKVAWEPATSAGGQT
ncbi:hypothetical protein GT002_33740 [Streptomyces sp. SID4917]|nr:hypothetical protein [Streptomyces sp. SID4917]